MRRLGRRVAYHPEGGSSRVPAARGSAQPSTPESFGLVAYPEGTAELDRSVTVVVFTADEKKMSTFDVQVGPCVPSPARQKPLVSPLMQDGGEVPAQTAALYTALTGQPDDDALRLLTTGGSGRLSVCSGAFVLAMRNASDFMLQLADEDEARGAPDIPNFAAQQSALDQAWLAAAVWPASVVSTCNRLHRLGLAAQALKKNQPLFVWHGPSLPMRQLTMGQGPYRGR